MQWSWMELWNHMGVPALLVAGTLLAMGFASLVVFVERLLVLSRSRRQGQRFLTALAKLEGRQDWQRLEALAKREEFRGAYVARAVRAGLSTYLQAVRHGSDSGLSPLEKTQRHMERYVEQLGAELRTGFSILAAVGSIAPFVGLLGTVVGIVSAFQGIAATGSGGLSAVAGGISEALVETALGLLVAIPAVLAFYCVSAQANAEEARLKNVVGELLDELEDHAAAFASLGGSEHRAHANSWVPPGNGVRAPLVQGEATG